MTETNCPAIDPEPARQLLRWYDENRRDLPWRRNPSPYHVWLSEIMLQQTRVEAVRGYYARFLARLPDIGSLAEADEDVYLKLWEGLGYYSRVRNLHRAAVQIMEEHGGQMPRTSKELLALPGIGPYTAAAIASICFGERIPAVDGNLLRIFARMTEYDRDIRSGQAKREADAFYRELFPEDRPGDANQALMDLGAGVCLPKGAPRCGDCPWNVRCAARRSGRAEDLPVTGPKKPRAIDEKTVFLIYYDQQLVLRKRADGGLLAGLYEFPNAEGNLSRAKATAYLRRLGFDALRMQALPPARHIFSHREWHMTGYQVLADEWTEFVSGQPKEHQLFLAGREALEEVYTIPSAFAAYQKEIRRDYLR